MGLMVFPPMVHFLLQWLYANDNSGITGSLPAAWSALQSLEVRVGQFHWNGDVCEWVATGSASLPPS